MSMVGEIENIDHEIRVKEMQIEALRKRRAELVKLMSVDDDEPWEYDGYGVKRRKSDFMLWEDDKKSK